jgi:hypothetical protein
MMAVLRYGDNLRLLSTPFVLGKKAMKAASKGKRPAASLELQEEAADRVLSRIKLITSELEALREDIRSEIKEPQSLNQPSSQENGTDMAFAQFKAALDRLRAVLWSYLEQVPDLGGASAWRNAQPLRSAATISGGYPPITLPQADSGPTPVSFFDRLDVVIDAYMKKSDSGMAPTPRKRGKP